MVMMGGMIRDSKSLILHLDKMSLVGSLVLWRTQQLVCLLKSHVSRLARFCLRCDEPAGLCMLFCMVILELPSLPLQNIHFNICTKQTGYKLQEKQVTRENRLPLQNITATYTQNKLVKSSM